MRGAIRRAFEIRLLSGMLSAAALWSPTYAAEPQPSSRTFAVPQSGLTFLTGDSWQQSGQTIRLYGVQACIRGTTYTDKSGRKQDCGAVSLAMLAAIFKDTRPSCAPVAQLAAPAPGQPPTVLVICSVHIHETALDIGTMLITQGFAFAALTSTGKPVYLPYSIDEAIAQQARAGLWAYPDVPHPNRLLISHPARPE